MALLKNAEKGSRKKLAGVKIWMLFVKTRWRKKAREGGAGGPGRKGRTTRMNWYFYGGELDSVWEVQYKEEKKIDETQHQDGNQPRQRSTRTARREKRNGVKVAQAALP